MYYYSNQMTYALCLQPMCLVLLVAQCWAHLFLCVCASIDNISPSFPLILFWLTRPTIVNFIDEAGNCSWFFSLASFCILLIPIPKINISFATIAWQALNMTNGTAERTVWISKPNQRTNERTSNNKNKIKTHENLLNSELDILCTVYSHGHPTC